MTNHLFFYQFFHTVTTEQIYLLPSCGTGYIHVVVVVTYITHVLHVCSSIHDSAAITCTFVIFFTVQQQQCAIIQVNHIQRVMPSGMEEGAPAVLGTVAFWSQSVPSGNTTSVIEAAVLDVTVFILDPLQQLQHVLAQMTGQRKEQQGGQARKKHLVLVCPGLFVCTKQTNQGKQRISGLF